VSERVCGGVFTYASTQIYCSHNRNARARGGIRVAALGGFADVCNSQSTANCLGSRPQALD